jgi:hypothetical protein
MILLCPSPQPLAATNLLVGSINFPIRDFYLNGIVHVSFVGQLVKRKIPKGDGKMGYFKERRVARKERSGQGDCCMDPPPQVWSSLTQPRPAPSKGPRPSSLQTYLSQKERKESSLFPSSSNPKRGPHSPSGTGPAGDSRLPESHLSLFSKSHF